MLGIIPDLVREEFEKQNIDIECLSLVGLHIQIVYIL